MGRRRRRRRKARRKPQRPVTVWEVSWTLVLILVCVEPAAATLLGSVLLGVWLLIKLWPYFMTMLERWVAGGARADRLQLSPEAFEALIARLVGDLPGWRASLTRRGTDQGADVILESVTGVRIAVQVKHYPDRNVGNSAVQQVVASKAYYRCEYAVVVTSGPGFTVSAQELAAANGVKLWDGEAISALQWASKRRQVFPPQLLPAGVIPPPTFRDVLEACRRAFRGVQGYFKSFSD